MEQQGESNGSKASAFESEFLVDRRFPNTNPQTPNPDSLPLYCLWLKPKSCIPHVVVIRPKYHIFEVGKMPDSTFDHVSLIFFSMVLRERARNCEAVHGSLFLLD